MTTAVAAPAAARASWHAVEASEAAVRLDVDPARGLSAAEASRRLRETGPNAVAAERQRTRLRVLVDQYANLLTGVLALALVLSLATGETTDAMAIAAILVLNGLLGYVQERRAATALAGLRDMTAPTARVRRDAASGVVPARDLVPGDLVVLEAGDRVPADIRLTLASDLRTTEAALTGESDATDKGTAAVDAATGLHARSGMAYLGTLVAEGAGEGVVVATGGGTELGRIAQLIGALRDEETPLQAQLRTFARRLVVASVALVALVFALGAARGLPLLEMFLASVGLAVAAVPEGLPAIVTIALALGVARMAKRQALVRRLPSVETLGCTTVICTDKTGTLTVGRMRLTEVRSLAGTWRAEKASEPTLGPSGGQRLAGRGALRAAAACSTARLLRRDGRTEGTGDPMEVAIVTAAADVGVPPEETDALEPVQAMAPFDPVRRRMSVLRRSVAGLRLYVKGAPEALLPICSERLDGDRSAALTAADRLEYLDINRDMADQGLRVLAVAQRDVGSGESMSPRNLEAGLTWLGFLGLEDPPRPEASAAVAACRMAGMRVVMITGDQAGTALAVARNLGIASRESEVMLGEALGRLDEAELATSVPSVSVYARTSPEHKLRIVKAWRSRGEIVAMTGDGVNDAPALKAADIGVAIGRDATDVAKEASDLVIADGNFATLVAAVEEGRAIYENVRKSLLYLLSGNCGEILFVGVVLLLGMPLPLLPIQLLWINLMTDGLPALALATDVPDRDLLARPPRAAGRRLADAAFLRAMLLTGFLVASSALAAFAWGLHVEGSLERARTYAFATIVAAEALRALVGRSDTKTVREVSILSNLRLVGAVALALGLQVWSHHGGPLGPVLQTGELDLATCGALLLWGAVPAAILEGMKLVRRRRLRDAMAGAGR